MRKIVAEIIAAFVPGKVARSRVRGLVNFGIIRALVLRRQMRRDKTRPKYYLAVAAIAKNEGEYFKEWLEWHRKLGVEKFYIYDNESTDNTKKVLAPYIKSGLVDYIFVPGRLKQILSYNDCLARHRTDARWIAFIDLDEFIVPLKDKTIPKFLERFHDFALVEINWLCYGSGGAKKKTAGDVMKRFLCHAKPDAEVNRHVKALVNPRMVSSFVGTHEAVRLSGRAADSHGNITRKQHPDRAPLHDVIRINHYAVKSWAEFLAKRARGRATRSLTNRGLEYFDKFDLNDIKEKA
ncbi:MAG: glycosyltransferase family 92 protein [Rickettsiales bacterium]|jgi:hypothetical protein|nr:glycosyltransferase family 92 protein [Rickettsiales bacterium]